ncbi:hypothetical protein [Duganella vulcania]|uniref:Uncharacterized protein n=1 Tax=Duganella vulcania TaxID=2692166 RepID=A0A845GD29_9BURK|nr:hypothetical protein [Duganella vulcania]MYM92523.1 hypothetical protein [Duganella vulcania]
MMAISPGQNVSAEHLRAAARGEERLMSWIHDGTLLLVDKVEAAWSVNRQTVDAAREEGEIFSVWVRDQHWYPAEALKFKREDLAAINRKLGEIDPSSKLLFLLHKHGAVGGMTPLDAVANRKLGDLLRLAAEWGRA